MRGAALGRDSASARDDFDSRGGFFLPEEGIQTLGLDPAQPPAGATVEPLKFETKRETGWGFARIHLAVLQTAFGRECLRQEGISHPDLTDTACAALIAEVFVRNGIDPAAATASDYRRMTEWLRRKAAPAGVATADDGRQRHCLGPSR